MKTGPWFGRAVLEEFGHPVELRMRLQVLFRVDRAPARGTPAGVEAHLSRQFAIHRPGVPEGDARPVARGLIVQLEMTAQSAAARLNSAIIRVEMVRFEL